MDPLSRHFDPRMKQFSLPQQDYCKTRKYAKDWLTKQGHQYPTKTVALYCIWNELNYWCVVGKQTNYLQLSRFYHNWDLNQHKMHKNLYFWIFFDKTSN